MNRRDQEKEKERLKQFYIILMAFVVSIAVASYCPQVGACEFSGALTYRHNSDPDELHELYVFDGLGVTTTLDACEPQPIFIRLGVHKQLNNDVWNYGKWRVELEIGWQLWGRK